MQVTIRCQYASGSLDKTASLYSLWSSFITDHRDTWTNQHLGNEGRQHDGVTKPSLSIVICRYYSELPHVENYPTLCTAPCLRQVPS